MKVNFGKARFFFLQKYMSHNVCHRYQNFGIGLIPIYENRMYVGCLDAWMCARLKIISRYICTLPIIDIKVPRKKKRRPPHVPYANIYS